MPSHNVYLTYKRDTSRLIYWLINTYNSIVKGLPPGQDGTRMATNTTGQTTVAGVVNMAKLIAEHINPIPSAIFSLLQSVIKARTSSYTAFQQMTASKPDKEIQQSNDPHKVFIDALTAAFEALGGDAWLSSRTTKTDDEGGVADFFANSFSAISLNDPRSDDADEGSSADEGSDVESRSAATQQKRQTKKPSSKGKKGKRGKKPKGKKNAALADEQNLKEVPLESYRIIEGPAGAMTDYMMAVLAVVKEWIHLRNKVREYWRNVAYNGLNGVVAASLSFMAIAMVRQTATAVFLDFPGHDSYEDIMKTITFGDPDNLLDSFQATTWIITPDGRPKLEKKFPIDFREQCLIYAYNDLYDFVTDFQKTRSGKPTKPMLAQIRDWDPNFDLEKATNEKRVQWRRSYTINWLYDLVNVYSSVVVLRNNKNGEHHAYEKVDWSADGPWRHHRRLFGLNEFAGEITTLAMQKDGTDVRRRILPHHVFHLQCIIDAMTISRGWSTSLLKGHVLDPPPRSFRARRDVDLFLDREYKRSGCGYLQAVECLKVLFDRDAEIHGDQDFNLYTERLLEGVQGDFLNWLGESKYSNGLDTIPPSRFSNSNSNGLWEYSPFLCGAGLLEALEVVYRRSMIVWDNMPEPMLLMHLHNMLVKKGYIQTEVDLFGALQQLFPKAFFHDGVPPDSKFGKALVEHTTKPKRILTPGRKANIKRQHDRLLRNTLTRDLLDPASNYHFKMKPNVMIYKKYNWDIERIPDKDVPLFTVVFGLRLRDARILVDPKTGKERLEDTQLTLRAKDNDVTDDELLAYAECAGNRRRGDMVQQDTNQILPKNYDAALNSATFDSPIPDVQIIKVVQSTSNEQSIERQNLQLISARTDIYSDICGMRPLLCFNYVFAICRFHQLFLQIEGTLKEQRNPHYIQAYERNDPKWRDNRRTHLTMLALKGEDEECLRTIAAEFENPRTEFGDHVYWDDIDNTMEKFKQMVAEEKEVESGCCVM